MDEAAYRQYELERDNWLKSGRRELLARQIRGAMNDHGKLEILDLGSGVGQNVPALQQLGIVDVLEVNEIGLRALRSTSGIREIFDQPIPFELDRRYDVIVATDVLEHIADDKGAAKWVADRLRPGGVFFSTVPAYQFLFSEHDVALHHFRRYTATSYSSIMPAELEIERCGYFNSVLFPVAATARLANRFLSKKKGPGQAEKQSSIVPSTVDAVFRSILQMEIAMIDKGLGLPFGLSVYCLARRL